MKKYKIVPVLLLFCASAYSQNSITGTFPGFANQQIRLIGFEGFDTYTIDEVKACEKGVFKLQYDKSDYGMGYLATENHSPFFVVLSGEIIKLTGVAFALPETIEILEGSENIIFGRYASEYPRRDQALSVWRYLKKIYRDDSLFSGQQLAREAMAKEMQRINEEDRLFLAGLSPDSYMSWYLPVRKLISSVSTIAQFRTGEIPATISAFRNIDYSDPRLYKSGLAGDVTESHVWLIENSGVSLDSVYAELKISIDQMVENLLASEQMLNETGEYLFNVFENRSLYKASEYLALKLLDQKSCTSNEKFSSRLESYRAMKTGRTAPDFDFNKDIIAPGYTSAIIPQKLSDLQSKYTVIVFGAGFCQQSPAELSQMARLYEKWKQYSIEVVFVSLDENKKIFRSFAGVFPFLSICDYQKWESPIVKSYHVFATPTIFLLDAKREILLRPNSASQLDSWIEWYLVQENE